MKTLIRSLNSETLKLPWIVPIVDLYNMCEIDLCRIDTGKHIPMLALMMINGMVPGWYGHDAVHVIENMRATITHIILDGTDLHIRAGMASFESADDFMTCLNDVMHDVSHDHSNEKHVISSTESLDVDTVCYMRHI